MLTLFIYFVYRNNDIASCRLTCLFDCLLTCLFMKNDYVLHGFVDMHHACILMIYLINVYIVMIYMTIVDVIYKVFLVNIKLRIIVNNVIKLMWYVWLLFANLYLIRFTCRAHMSILYGQIQNLFRIRDMVN